VTHEVTMSKVREWLEGACNSPNDNLVKGRLKGLLAS
jgi:hypothetical protein